MAPCRTVVISSPNPHQLFFPAHFPFSIIVTCIISSHSRSPPVLILLKLFLCRIFPNSTPKKVCLQSFFLALIEYLFCILLLVEKLFNWNRFPAIIIIVYKVAFRLIPFCQLLSAVFHPLACFVLHTKGTLLSHLVAIFGVTAF